MLKTKRIDDIKLQEVAGGLLNVYLLNAIGQGAVGTSNTNIVGDLNNVHPLNLAVYKKTVNITKITL